jgi:transposase
MSHQTQQPEPEFAAFVGIDWADRQHCWACQMPGSLSIQQGELPQTPEAVEEWAMELHRRFGGAPVAVALEQSRGALIFLLAKYPHLVLYPVHPTSLANYRKSFRPSGAKGDPSDASLVLDMLVHHRDRLRRLSPDTAETRTLQLLVEHRRKLVNDRTRFTNRLTSQLKLYFPQILEWFDTIHSPLVGDLLERWPTLQELQKAKPATLRRFLTQHNCRGQEKIDQRLEQIRQAVPATSDFALLTASRSAVCALVALLRAVRDAIAAHDERIEHLARCHPDFAIFASLPGAGPVLVPRLIAALGTQRDRYGSAHEIQCYSGIAPVKESSGQQEWVHWRWACPKFVRQTFHEWAGHSIGFSQWARTYYDGQRALNKAHHAAVRALAFKWIRILFRCWQNRTPYDETIYLNALLRRQPPLIAPPKPTVDLKLKKRGGFWKITAADA